MKSSYVAIIVGALLSVFEIIMGIAYIALIKLNHEIYNNDCLEIASMMRDMSVGMSTFGSMWVLTFCLACIKHDFCRIIWILPIFVILNFGLIFSAGFTIIYHYTSRTCHEWLKNPTPFSHFAMIRLYMIYVYIGYICIILILHLLECIECKRRNKNTNAQPFLNIQLIN